MNPLCLKIMDFRNCIILTYLAFDNQIKYHYRSTPTSIHAPGVTFYEPSGGKVDSEWRTIMDVWAAGSYPRAFDHLQPTQPRNAALRVEFWKRLSIWNESM
ncbi:hypothetical protein CIHG_02796 [Coccidioides immitis H538.4]|uniref:Uncharacterized protein n=3 Tax=Coccidioides immitis TaxID=5501 RepID=A0A0J8QH17_COCIT|nr:hypothetical protein CIRG_07510 [Coccidioides immitis RMSCC 2394]KMU71710.1 hypothetical protein CISG_00020 [Coccidioides immitis RMSCC 3703]KMU85013.1 hypothetical protein CIHG_02796 [Coccidioides immitis H538.4]